MAKLSSISSKLRQHKKVALILSLLFFAVLSYVFFVPKSFIIPEPLCTELHWPSVGQSSDCTYFFGFPLMSRTEYRGAYAEDGKIQAFSESNILWLGLIFNEWIAAVVSVLATTGIITVWQFKQKKSKTAK